VRRRSKEEEEEEEEEEEKVPFPLESAAISAESRVALPSVEALPRKLSEDDQVTPLSVEYADKTSNLNIISYFM